MLKLHLINSVSICYTSKFATDTVKKTNRWSWGLSLSVGSLKRRTCDNQSPSCAHLLIAARPVARTIVSKSTVAQTKMGHVRKTTPFLGIICHPFESSSFSHSWDIDGTPKIWNVSRDVTTPLCPSAGTSYRQPVQEIWSLYVYSLWRYEKWQKMQKLGRLGG